MICLVLTGRSLDENLAALRACRSLIDLVELRADFLEPGELSCLPRFPSTVDLPVILTVRRERDGGRFRSEERERLALLGRALAPAGGNGEGRAYAYVDLEDDLPPLAAIEALCDRRETRIIRSFHDFTGMPADLVSRVLRAPRSAREIPKAAVMPRTTAIWCGFSPVRTSSRRKTGAREPSGTGSCWEWVPSVFRPGFSREGSAPF